MAAESPARMRLVAWAALAAVLLVSLAQVTLQPTAAPLVTELGLEPWHVGAAVSVSATMMLVAIPAWSRLLRAHGARGPLVAALLLAAAGSAGFATLAMLGSHGRVDGAVLVASLLGLRGVVLGAGIAAVVPASRLVIASLDATARAHALGWIATVQGLAVITGAALGGALSTFGALVPLVATPLLILLAAVGVAAFVPRGAGQEQPGAPRTSVRMAMVDARTWPFGLVGLALMSVVASVQVALGFAIRDRLALDAATTGFATGSLLFVGALAAVVVQSRLGRAGGRPVAVLRVGLACTTIGVGLLVVSDGIVGIVLGVLAAGIGVGLAMSGLARAVARSTGERLLGSMLVSTATVVGVVVGPPIAGLLVGVSDAAPFVASAALLAASLAFALAHPAFRTARAPVPVEESVAG